MSYTVEIDDVEQLRWHRLLREFEDATIFQTWAYGSARWGKENLSHAVIKKQGEVVGLAQSILVGIPLLGRALALVIFGPVWQRRGGPRSIEHLQGAVNALRREYAGRRRLCLRLRPWPHDFSQQLAAAMLAEGAWCQSQYHPTYILDLARSESELRRSMDKKWRANLRRAEQCALTVSQENEREGIRIFTELHGEMRERKQSIASDFVDMLPALYDGLPEDLKPKIFVCWRGTEPAASAIVSALGSKAFYLNGASGNSALDVRAGYILQWAIVRWLKETGISRWYDLNGAMSSPGVRQFKRGLVGAKAPEIPIDEFEACESRLAAFIVRSGSRLNERYRNLWLRSKWLRR